MRSLLSNLWRMIVNLRLSLALLLCMLLGSPLLSASPSPQIRTVQSELKALGYQPGPIDGLWGGKTRRALKKFQKDQGLPVTGRLDEVTLARLHALAAPQKAEEPATVPSEAPETPGPAQPSVPAPDIAAEGLDAGAVVSTPAPVQGLQPEEVPDAAPEEILPPRRPPAADLPIAESSPPTPVQDTKASSLAQYRRYTKDRPFQDPLLHMKFVYIPGGCFLMGSTQRLDEQPVHEVCVREHGGFLLGQYEVTQQAWEKVMGTNPSGGKRGDRLPVNNVSWDEIQKFLARLNEKGKGRYRLPTESEWEYATRAGSGGNYWWGDEPPVCDHEKINGANFAGEGCPGQAEPVGSYAPNPFGLYDVHGNLWEWVEDVYLPDAYARHDRQDPLVTTGGTHRVFRGGSWLYPAQDLRSARRDHHIPSFRFFHLGFRLVYEP